METKYYHNGEVVSYQSMEGNFLSLLNKMGIIPEEVPFLDFPVYIYTVNDEKRYAACVSADVYITDSVPVDGWLEMVRDVNRQVFEKVEPIKMESRLHLVISKAENKASKYMEDVYPDKAMNFCLGIFTEEEQKKWDHAFGVIMRSYGYTKDNILKISASDVDKESLSKILL